MDATFDEDMEDDLSQGRSQVRPQVRPWVRFWARIFDIYIFALAVGILFSIFPFFLPVIPGGDNVMALIILLLWIFVEAFFLIMTGTTPGKWVFRIKLIPEDDLNFTYFDALKRSVKVWFRGLGLGIPLIGLFTLVIAYRNLKNNGITSWDKEGGFSVEHENIGWIRISLLVLFFGGFIGLLTLGILAAQ